MPWPLAGPAICVVTTEVKSMYKSLKRKLIPARNNTAIFVSYYLEKAICNSKSTLKSDCPPTGLSSNQFRGLIQACKPPRHTSVMSVNKNSMTKRQFKMRTCGLPLTEPLLP